MGYKRLNNIFGWATFAIAAFVFCSTIEPTASFWDCGEYIATSYKLEVGHPPGAPFFLLVGRLFSMFSSPENAAVMINTLSALCSAFTILFLFWTITALAKRLALLDGGKMDKGKMSIIFGSAFVGALAYTFTDSFWFSAEEGEVYAMSSLFTAIVFWAILRWEVVADQPGANKWLVFIAYLVGLSIGVHLLSLLVIPAITFVIYFKKYKTTTKGLIITTVLSVILLGLVQNVIIPGVVKLIGKFELLFVNTFGLPFNSGAIFFMLLLVIGIIFGLMFTAKRKMGNAYAAILSFAVLLIGYSTFMMVVIRSNANPPMDENNPENPISLLAYLGRDQYGDWPLVKGQFFNSPLNPQQPYLDGNPVYAQDKERGKYVVIDDKKNSKPNYADEFQMVFPRMWSQEGRHRRFYKSWSDFKGKPVPFTNMQGKREIIYKPTFVENLRYMFRYQIGWMYARYFMWNFAGRQNDVQGHGNPLDGNWISGFDWLDSARLTDQGSMPDSLKANKARNTFYLLPLLLGLIGLFFHFQKHPKDGFVVLLLFLFTGLAIVFYLNQYPLQPRERDYAYAGSFYVFAIWIGLGVMAIADALNRKLKLNLMVSGLMATAVCFFAVPVVMGQQGWDDHDRSGRFTARDFAKDYLASCAPNAILFTNGDNDTFPLWYVQEVEGYRTDVRVINLSLLNTDWYIDQCRRKAYDSDPVPFSMSPDKYRSGTRDYLVIYKNNDLFEDERFAVNSDQFAEPYKQFVNIVSQLLEHSDFPQTNPDEFAAIKAGASQYKASQMFKLAQNLAKQENIDKYGLNRALAKQASDVATDIEKRVKRSGIPVQLVIDWITDDNNAAMFAGGNKMNYVPGRKFALKVDKQKVLESGCVSKEDADQIVPVIRWKLKKNKNIIMKNEMMVMDLLAHNNWERPVYFAFTTGEDVYMGLQDYFRLEGFAYRLVPIKRKSKDSWPGWVDPDMLYDKLINQFVWGGIDDPGIWVDWNNRRMCMNIRNNFYRLAEAYVERGDKKKAEEVLDFCMKLMPEENVPYGVYTMFLAEAYFHAGARQKAIDLTKKLCDQCEAELNYFYAMDTDDYASIKDRAQQNLSIYARLAQTAAMEDPDGELGKSLQEKLTALGNRMQSINATIPGKGAAQPMPVN